MFEDSVNDSSRIANTNAFDLLAQVLYNIVHCDIGRRTSQHFFSLFDSLNNQLANCRCLSCARWPMDQVYLLKQTHLNSLDLLLIHILNL